MAIPIEKGRSQKIARQIKALEEELTGATKDVRRLLYKALQASQQNDNGVTGALERMQVFLDLAIDRGLPADAITMGGGMTKKIGALLDREPALSQAAGLGLEFADLLAEAGYADDSAAVLAIVNKIDRGNTGKQWREVTRPVVERVR